VERLVRISQRPPEPGGEIDIGRARDHLAHGLEHARLDDQCDIGRLVLAEGLEEDAVAVHGDDGIEQVGLPDPGIVRPDRLSQRPERDAQDEAVLAHEAMEAHAPAQVGRQPDRGRIARGVEGGRRGIVDEDDHAAALAYR
jgi:hypothetical protein